MCVLCVYYVFVQYVMDEEKIANLLQIPLFYDLEIYVSSRQEKVSVTITVNIGSILLIVIVFSSVIKKYSTNTFLPD